MKLAKRENAALLDEKLEDEGSLLITTSKLRAVGHVSLSPPNHPSVPSQKGRVIAQLSLIPQGAITGSSNGWRITRSDRSPLRRMAQLFDYPTLRPYSKGRRGQVNFDATLEESARERARERYTRLLGKDGSARGTRSRVKRRINSPRDVRVLSTRRSLIFG